MILKTERLILRPIVQDDLDNIFSLAKNPNIGPNAGWKPHDDKDETNRIMQELFIGKETVWAITKVGENNLIGVIGLEDDPKRSNPNARMIGYWLDESHWGNGIMTEAAKEVIRYGFEELNLPIITSNCFTFNESSRNIIEKIGMNHEGTLKQAEERYDKKVFDIHMYSLTKEAYTNK